MNFSDLTYILRFWLIWFLLGIIFLPLTRHIFKDFFDQGYAFSKILGLLITSYLIWLLASINLLKFNTTSLYLLLGIFLAFNLAVTLNNRFDLKMAHIKFYLLEELLFFAGVLFWSWVRGFEPSIHGLEKFMDFGFINSILRSEYFPPKDIWLPPLPINYYYFGHLSAALVTLLSGIKPQISYNLYLAALFGLCLSASFSIGANIHNYFESAVKLKLTPTRFTLVSGFLSAFLVTLAGNLHPIYAFFKNYTPPENPIPFWQLTPMFNFVSYWYPNATRFIPFTIHEFPIYSFVVADLHGHVLDIPFVLLFMGLLVKFFFDDKISETLFFILMPTLLATFLMSNILDGPIYLMILTLVLFFKFLKQNPISNAFVQTMKFSLPALLLTVILALPFFISFKPFASGIGVLCAPQFLTGLGKVGPFLFEENHCLRSPIWMLAILWGFFYSAAGLFILFIRKNLRQVKLINNADYISLVLIFAALILIIIPEFFYAKDIYPQHYRANTVFKFGYQAFIILGLVCGYMITRLIASRKLLSLIILAPLFVLVAIYPYFAVNSYYGYLQNSKGLDGLKYLHDLYPNDLELINWFNTNVSGQPVILEAQGDSYTDYARISANTGLPTVIGWPVHEWLWRGSYDEAGKRSSEVTQVYESPDLKLTANILSKYKVAYLVLGDLERKKYLNLKEDKFASLGKVVFETGQTKLYKLN